MKRFLLWAGFLLFCFHFSENAYSSLTVDAYITVDQTKTLVSLAERERLASQLQSLKIQKIVLETMRGNVMTSKAQIEEIKKYFENKGFIVSGGINPVFGPFGVQSNQSRYYLNYEDPKTQQEMLEHIQLISPLFSEIVVDDFFATDDTTEISIKAKGSRDWPTYRMDLLTAFAQKYMLGPAHQINPALKMIIKFPQSYDRFHVFGYDAEREPELFDGVWVGCETRNPDTVRFGYVMATEGYCNYRWLASIAKQKSGAAWFDFGDCEARHFLMQAYQSILAGAHELTLFNGFDIASANPALASFQQRRDALDPLSAILGDSHALGLPSYKPQHSNGCDANGGANLYIFDYMAELGLSPLPAATLTGDEPVIFLPRHAVDDPAIQSKINKLLENESIIVVTPDFISALKDEAFTKAAGFSFPLNLTNQSIIANSYHLDGVSGTIASSTMDVRIIPKPVTGKIICSAANDAKEVPLLVQNTYGKKGKIITINIATFTHDEFAPGKEQYLPPRPLSLCQWPRDIVNTVRNVIPSASGLRFDVSANVGINPYNNGTVVLANFNPKPEIIKIRSEKNLPNGIKADARFPHVDGVRIVSAKTGGIEITVPSWEIVVLQRE